MCKRFIEDLSNKIIEKLDVETLDNKELKETIKKCKTILDQREEDLITELVKVYHLENCSIKRRGANSVQIFMNCYPQSRNKKITFYYDHYNKTHGGTHDWDGYVSPKAYHCYEDHGQVISFLTKEELLNHLIKVTKIKDKDKLYEICLKKINLIEDLIINY